MTISKVWKIVREVEQELCIALSLDFLEIEDRPFQRSSAYFIIDSEGYSTISIGSNLKGRELRAAVYHEIGHALEEIQGAKQFMKPFLRDKNSKRYEGFRYELATRTFFLWKQLPVPRGFTSLYATLSPSEDWADTFCDVMMNKIFPKNDHKLQAKVQAVKNLIEYLRNQ